MKQKSYTIPKGYKGISNDITLTFNSPLAVITGLNGCGKSTILKYLYETHPNREKVFIKTSQSQNNERGWQPSYRFTRRADNISFDEIIEKVERVYKFGFIRNHPFMDKTDFYSALFNEDSLSYEEGYNWLKKIADILAEYQLDTLENIQTNLGILTQQDIKNGMISELNKNKDNNEIDYGIKTGRNIYSRYEDNSLTPEAKIKFETKKKIY